MSKSSFWLIDRTLSGATTLEQGGPGSDNNEEELSISKPPALQELHYQIV